MKLYKELENKLAVKLGTIDDDILNNNATININIQYNGYIKVEENELEDADILRDRLVEFIIDRIFRKDE